MMAITKRTQRRLQLESLEGRDLLSVWTVTSAVDGDPGSLRDCVQHAESGDVIRFSQRLSRTTLHLSKGELSIDKSLTIQGSKQTLDADGLSRIFAIQGSAVDVVLSDLTLTDGKATLFETVSYEGYAGGAILVDGANVTLRRCSVTNSLAQGAPVIGEFVDTTESALGGGIAAFDAQITLERSVVRGNRALGSNNSIDQQAGLALGGGVFMTGLETGAHLIVIGGQISENLAQGGSGSNPIEAFPQSDGGWGAGGGVWLGVADATMTDVSLSGNRALGGNGSEGSMQPKGPGGGGSGSGGAIFIQGPQSDQATSTLSLNHVSLVGNLARGGEAGAMADNTQGAKQGGSGAGGAIANVAHTTLLISGAIIDGNVALGGGVGPNAADAGANAGAGGPARGGSLFSDTPTRIEVTDLVLRNNLARGAAGANSAPESGTYAGTGGWAYGGGWFLVNNSGGKHKPATLLPVAIRRSTFEKNAVIGGDPGSGTIFDDGKGAGGAAIGGGLSVAGTFDLSMLDTRWLNNETISGQGKLSFGGAVSVTYGSSQSKAVIEGGVLAGNRVLGGSDASNATYREASGGAILNNAPNTVIRNVTFKNNAAVGGADTGSGHVGFAEGGAISNMLRDRGGSLVDLFSPAWPDPSRGDAADDVPVFEAGSEPTLEIYKSVFQSNIAQGGAILHGDGLTEPDAGVARGGAIYHDVSTLLVSGCSFSGNLAQASKRGAGRTADGGAIYAFGYSQQYGYTTTLQLVGNSFVCNRAVVFNGNVARGGAVAQMGQVFEDHGSSYRSNSASGACRGTAYGGALSITNGTALLDNVTATRNSATGLRGYGGGIAFENNPKAALLADRVFANAATTEGANVWGEYEPV